MRGLALLMILSAALLLRFYRLDQPLDVYETRQYIGAISARAIYYAAAPNIPQEQREFALAMRDHVGLLEPQILPMLAAWSYRLAGGEILWLPRAVSALCWVLGGVVILAIARRQVSFAAGMGAAAFYLFSPFAIIGSRTFQPDPMMVLLTLLTLILVVHYDDKPVGTRLFAAMAALLGAMIVRPMASCFVFPVFLLLAVARHGAVKGSLHWHTVLFAFLPVIPPGVFYLQSAAQGGFITTHADFSFMPHLYWENYFWMGWLRNIGKVTGWIPFLAAVGTAIFLTKGKVRSVLLGLWLGYLGYGLLFNYHIYTHDYYSLPLIPVVALSLAPLFGMGLQVCRSVFGERRRILLAGVAIFGSGAVVLGGLRSYGMFSAPVRGFLKAAVGIDHHWLSYLGREDARNRQSVEDWEEIGRLVRHSRGVILLSKADGLAEMYHGRFMGKTWPTRSIIEQYRKLGRSLPNTTGDFERIAEELEAEYFVVTHVKDFADQTQFEWYVRAHYPLVAGSERFLVFSLSEDQVSLLAAPTNSSP